MYKSLHDYMCYGYTSRKQPQSSNLPSSIVLDAVNISDSEEISDQDRDNNIEHSGMLEYE